MLFSVRKNERFIRQTIRVPNIRSPGISRNFSEPDAPVHRNLRCSTVGGTMHCAQEDTVSEPGHYDDVGEWKSGTLERQELS